MDNKEISMAPDQWNSFFIKIAYPPKINLTENDMKEEFKKGPPLTNFGSIFSTMVKYLN